jgi:hypothetical protein
MKFGISSLMIIVFAASVVCGIGFNGSFVAFGVGFVALVVLLIHLIAKSGPRPVVVGEMTTETEAHMLRNYLEEHGVDARVEGGRAGLAYPTISNPRVVVPLDQASRTMEILMELRQHAQRGVGPEVQ